MAGGDWELIAPYGEFPTADRKRIQKFGKPQAEAMVATFNSVWHRLGTMFRGVPIFHGHPDVDPKSWTDDRRLGKVVEIEAREDGLYGKPEWNALGADNAREGWWLYPSPAWLHPKTSATVVMPDELLSIGMDSFAKNCVAGIEPNLPRIAELVERSLMLVTALAPVIGYDNAAKIAKDAHHNNSTLKQAALASGLVDEATFDAHVRPEDMV
jgi:hypothetical protein